MYEYIMFVLGADTTDISIRLRKKVRNNSDLWGAFQDCEYIYDKFLEYDKNYGGRISELESFYKFIEEYHTQLVNFIEDGTHFEIKGE